MVPRGVWACLGAGLVWLAAVAAPSPSAPSGEKVDFDKEVLPILSEKCFKCHGPDAASRQAGLRLDTFEGATLDLGGGERAVTPGKPDSSMLVKRVTSKDSPMPPPETGKHVSAAEADTLRRWIAQGAKYSKHWAFEPVPRVVPVPRAGDGWAVNDIDRFIAAQLQEEGLKPTRPANADRIGRRLALDLTGLPPEDQLGSLDDRTYAAYVDKLLASPAFGEKMAVDWLDAARYGDSYGYQSDLLAPFWPYRDWVVRAFNQNMPYDQFVTKQLAGDLLPGGSTDDKLATCFNRLHRQSNEGGSIAADFKNTYAVDRVDTYGTAILGLTVGCARCHDHKYDPITQREFYQLYAYFDSIDEYGLLLSSEIVPSPSLMLPSSAQKAEISKWLGETAKANSELVAARNKALAGKGKPGQDGSVKATFTFGEIKEGKYPTESADPKVFASPIGSPKYLGGAGAVQLSGDDGIVFHGLPGKERFDAFTWALSIKDPRDKGPVVLLHRTGGTDVGFCGFDLMLIDGRVRARVMRTWPGNALAVETKDRLPKDAWTNVAWTYDGSGSVEGLKIYIDGERAATNVLGDKLWKKIDAYGDLGDSHGDWCLGQRFRDAGFKGGAVRKASFISREAGPAECAALGSGSTSAKATLEASAYGGDAAVQAAVKHLREAQDKLTQAEEGVLEVEVMQESKEPTPTYILFHGMYDAPVTEKDRVERGVPKVLSPLEAQGKNNRLDLARWTTRKDNPLTARVEVNRIWQMIFGTGLVETQENFGVQGSRPTHPELLDYLARRFMDSGWDIKKLVKEIVMSATFRQDSVRDPAGMAKDPQNKLLWHGPSMRLSAEEMRDTVLAASGLLDRKMGGPPVNPYQPAGIWTENNGFSQPFVQSKGSDLYRRSVYSTVKRTTPVPSMLVFDAGSRESCIVRRPMTDTPLQALVLLNDVQYVEAARVLAERVMKQQQGTSAQVRSAFLLAASRMPDEAETNILLQVLADQRKQFSSDQALVTKLLAEGDKKPDQALDKTELAAMTVVCQAILNSDAVVWKR